MTPSEVVEKAALEGKSVRQVIDETHPNASESDRNLLAKVVVANAFLALYEAGATPEQMCEVWDGLDDGK
jgi:hypothetical protein